MPEELITLDGEGHAIVSGPTGAGKSAGILIPTLLRYPGPIVAIDIKGELAAATSEHRKKFGPVHVIDPFRVTGATSGLNPLDSFDHADGDEYDLAVEIAHSVSRTLHATDPFWDQAAQSLIARFILLLGAHLPRCAARSLPSVRKLMSASGSDLGELLAYAWMSSAAAGELQTLQQIYDAAPQTLASVLATAHTQLSVFGGGAVDASLAQSSVATSDILSGAPMTIYLVIPPQRLQSHAPLLRAWMTQLLSLMFRRGGKVANDTMFLIDEAAQLGQLDIMPALYSLARGYSVRSVTVWQDLEQLERTYADSYRTMVANASAIVQLATDPADAHAMLTKILGHAPRSRTAIATAHLANEGRAVAMRPGYYFEDPEFEAIAKRSAISQRIPAARTRPLSFDLSRAMLKPTRPAEHREYFPAMWDTLDRYSILTPSPRPLRFGPDVGFRNLLRRLLGPSSLDTASQP